MSYSDYDSLGGGLGGAGEVERHEQQNEDEEERLGPRDLGPRGADPPRCASEVAES